MRVKQYDEDLDLETTEVQSLKQKMGSGPLNTDAQQVIPAINEIKQSLSNFLPCYTPSMTVVQTSITSQSSAQDYTFNDDGIYSFAVTGTTSGQEMVISLSTLDGAILIFHRAYNQNSDIIHTTLFGLKKGTYKLQLKGTNCYIKKYTP